MDGSKEGNVYRGWWPLSSLHVPRKNFSCQSSTEIYTTFCLSKENYRKNCAFSCNCWVRRGWRWETQSCHSGPMGKQFTAWHNSFSQYLSSGSSLYGLANLSTFHEKLGYLLIAVWFLTVVYKPDLLWQWAEQPKKQSLPNATATAPGNLEEVRCGRLGLVHTVVGNLGIPWDMVVLWAVGGAPHALELPGEGTVFAHSAVPLSV